MDITLTLFDAGAVLTLPAIIAVRRLLTLRLAAPLPRSVLESNLVLASSLAGAIGAIAWACVVPEAEMTLAFGAAPLGVIPWIAGETLSGGSSRRWESLGAAIVTAAATI